MWLFSKNVIKTYQWLGTLSRLVSVPHHSQVENGDLVCSEREAGITGITRGEFFGYYFHPTALR